MASKSSSGSGSESATNVGLGDHGETSNKREEVELPSAASLAYLKRMCPTLMADVHEALASSDATQAWNAVKNIVERGLAGEAGAVAQRDLQTEYGSEIEEGDIEVFNCAVRENDDFYAATGAAWDAFCASSGWDTDTKGFVGEKVFQAYKDPLWSHFSTDTKASITDSDVLEAFRTYKRRKCSSYRTGSPFLWRFVRHSHRRTTTGMALMLYVRRLGLPRTCFSKYVAYCLDKEIAPLDTAHTATYAADGCEIPYDFDRYLLDHCGKTREDVYSLEGRL